MTTVFELLDLVRQAATLRERLIVGVCAPDTRRTDLLHQAANSVGAQVANMNLELSTRLDTKSVTPWSVQTAFEEITATHTVTTREYGPLIFLEHIELLCDVDLRLDVLRLFRQMARTRTVVVAWKGKLEDGKLIYAELGHPEYRSYRASEFLTALLD